VGTRDGDLASSPKPDTAAKKPLGPKGMRRAVALARARAFWLGVVKIDIAEHCEKAGASDDRILNAFMGREPSTLVRHMSGWRRWRDHCVEVSSHAGCPSGDVLAAFCHELLFASADVLLHDGALVVNESNSGAAGVRSMLQAMSFVAKKCGAYHIVAAIIDPSVKGLADEAKLKTPLRNAQPFSVAIIVGLERLVIGKLGSLGDRLLAGGVLVCIWGGLRFADLCCCSPGSLSLDGWVLRGLCWRTKTARRGMPWGVLGCGLTGSCPSGGWVQAYARDLHRWCKLLPPERREAIDFLVPHFTEKGLVPGKPLEGWCAVRRLHKVLRGTTDAADPSSFGLHSAKGTLLSWAAQLLLDPLTVCAMGHHKPHTGAAPATYTKDDVFRALAGQETVLRRLKTGWRPMRARARGAEPPLPEPDVVLECSVDWPSDEFHPGRSLLLNAPVPDSPWDSDKWDYPAGPTCAAGETTAEDSSEGELSLSDIETVSVMLAGRVKLGNFFCVCRAGKGNHHASKCNARRSCQTWQFLLCLSCRKRKASRQ
jgi:hypothetical protein